MEKTEILTELAKGRNCAQCVAGAFADETGYDTDETDLVFQHFGGGMYTGQTCGAVVGAVAALGMMEQDKEKVFAFQQKFKERFGSCVCYELLGNMMPPEAREAGKFTDICPDYIQGAIDILEDILEESN